MNPNAEIQKKRDNFKKSLRKEQLESKRMEARKTLPYYEAMFTNSQPRTDLSNSRSTRFPVPNKTSDFYSNSNEPNSSKFQTNLQNSQEVPQAQIQMRYIEYLRNLKSNSREQRKEEIISQLSKKYGSDCFSEISYLADRIQDDLIQCEASVVNYSEESLVQFDWGFILAVHYFAENQNMSTIQEISLNLMTNHFIPWFQALIESRIVKNMTLEDFFKVLHEEYQNLRVIEDVILANYIFLKEEPSTSQERGEINEQKYQKILYFFSQKFEMFLDLQNYLHVTYPDQEETYFFSEIVYDFPFLYFIQTFSQIVFSKETSTEIKVNCFNLTNKYFADYPVQVESQTQTIQKLQNFLSFYMKHLFGFIKLLFNSQNLHEIEQNCIGLIKSTVKLIRSMIWRQLNNEIHTEQVIMFLMVVNLTVKLQLSSQIFQLISLHANILDLATVVFSVTESIQETFKDNSLMDYFCNVLNEWRKFKIQIRREGIASEIYAEKQFYLRELEFKLIQCLRTTKEVVSTFEVSEFDASWIQSMFQFADMMFKKERETIIHLKKNEQGKQIATEMLLFEENIFFYFKVMRNTEIIFNPNPESHECIQEDLEI